MCINNIRNVASPGSGVREARTPAPGGSWGLRGQGSPPGPSQRCLSLQQCWVLPGPAQPGLQLSRSWRGEQHLMKVIPS